MKHYISILLVLFFAACNGSDDKVIVDPSVAPPPPTPAVAYTIVAQYPHDTSAYTQGLQLYNGKLYEGTGDYTNSSLRITDLKSGKVEKKHMMGSDEIFGEGINIFKGKIYQLTWKSHVVYVYDINNIDKPIKTFQWANEGWGVTNNGTDLIVSDGSSNLYIVNPEDFRVKNTIPVTERGSPVDNINELEYIDGFVYANIYTTDRIIKIDPQTGKV